MKSKNEGLKRGLGTASTIGIVLLIFGTGLFVFNYERQTVDVQSIDGSRRIIDYYAPLWDPLPHHVKLTVETSKPIEITIHLENGDTSSETQELKSGEMTRDVYPGERIKIDVENPQSADGILKSVLWCDSWNYAAAILVVLALVMLFLI